MDAPQDCTLPLLDGYSKNKRPAWVPRRLWRARELLQHWTPVNLVFFSVVFGLLTGVVALTYNSILDWILDGTWSAFPKHAFLPLIEHLHSRWDWFPEPGSVAFVYVLIVATLYGTLAGVVQAYMGYPGDLPDSIELLHEKGYIPIQQAPSQFLCSSFSIASGASLGPEAPILSICAATTGWVSSRVFGHTGAMLRACTLMGMASGLSALFGVGLGGSIFAFEVLHMMGLQFFEVLNYAVGCGLVCLFVMRGLWGFRYALKPFGALWDFGEQMGEVDSRHILLGVLLGFVGAFLAFLFMEMNRLMKAAALAVKFDESRRPILCGAVGGLLIGIIGVFLPTGMFWSEYELETVADVTNPLPHLWPKAGFWGLAPLPESHYTVAIWFSLAFVKLLTINISVLSGLRGGLIFPLLFSGACFGRGLAMIPGIPGVSDESPVLASMVIAGAACTGITRTPFAVTLILTTLSGDPGVAAPTLCGALTSFFVLHRKPFFLQQRDRSDLVFKTVDFDLDLDGSPSAARRHPLQVSPAEYEIGASFEDALNAPSPSESNSRSPEALA